MPERKKQKFVLTVVIETETDPHITIEPKLIRQAACFMCDQGYGPATFTPQTLMVEEIKNVARVDVDYAEVERRMLKRLEGEAKLGRQKALDDDGYALDDPR